MRALPKTPLVKSSLLLVGVTSIVWLGCASASFAGGHGPAEAEAPHGDGADAVNVHGNGIDLGEYRIRSYYPVQAQKSIVTFALYAAAKPEQLADARRIVKERRHKLRDQVITATRLTPLAEFDDPDLARFRRRLILRLRRTMPELPLEDAYVSNFELKVQSL